jgi:hypothetical protein
VVELEPLLFPLERHLGEHVDQQLVEFSRCQVHNRVSLPDYWDRNPAGPCRLWSGMAALVISSSEPSGWPAQPTSFEASGQIRYRSGRVIAYASADLAEPGAVI